MNNQGKQNFDGHKSSDVSLRSRKHIDVTGVEEVLSFDDVSVSMVTCCGEMTVEGSGLKIGTLDTGSGIVSVDGRISAVIYYDEPERKEKKRVFGRAFGK